MYDNQMKNKEKPEVSPRVPSRSSASMNKSPVMTSLDDLSLMFGGKFLKFIDSYFSEVVDKSFILLVAKGSPSSEFQEVEGETEERRKARLGRHQRAQERAVCIIMLSLFLLIRRRELINANYTSSFYIFFLNIV